MIFFKNKQTADIGKGMKVKINILYFIRFFAIFLVFLLISVEGYAYSCGQPSIKDVLDGSSILFVGTVEKTVGDKTIVNVEDVFKGILPKKAEIIMPVSFGNLSRYILQNKKRYFFVANIGIHGEYNSYDFCGVGTTELLTLEDLRDWNDYMMLKGRLHEQETYLLEAKVYRDYVNLENLRYKNEKTDRRKELLFSSYYTWHDYQSALKFFEEDLTYFLSPKRFSSGQEYSHVQYIELLVKVGRLTDAKTYVEGVFSRYPDSSEYQKYYSWVMYLSGDVSRLRYGVNNFYKVNATNKDINLSSRNFRSLRFLESSIDKVDFFSSIISDLYVDKSMINGVDFSGTNLSKIIGDEANFYGISFKGRGIDKFSLRKSKISFSQFDDMKILFEVEDSGFYSVSFNNVDLSECQFKKTQLSNVSFKNTNLSGCDLSGLYTYDEKGIDFSEAKYDRFTEWPKNMNGKILMPSKISSESSETNCR